MLDSLDAAAVRRWCAAGLDALRRHQREIDELNVYPVPDGDTGTNLVLTVTSAHHALAGEPDCGDPDRDGEITRLGRVLRCMARGALLGARGNSGVIVSQILRGLADALAVTPAARGRLVAEALSRAADAAYQAVADPVEGTVLSVARGAADAAAQADSDDLAAVVSAAAAGASAALARTPAQLAALARAGVVDAGGRGLVVLLEALVDVVGGTAPGTAPLAAMAADPALLEVARETGSARYAYEVQYLLDAPPAAVGRLRAQLAGLGDSLVIVGTGAAHPDDEQTWNVHVHVNDIGAAIEAGVRAGRPHRIAVTRFADGGAAAPSHVDAEARGVVVLANGSGLGRLFTGEGAVVVSGSAPSTTAVLDAILATVAGQVVVLPHDPNAHAVVSAAAAEARERGRLVSVVPTRSPVQALAALAVRDPARRFDDDVIAMAEAAGACRYAAVGRAARDAGTAAGPCRAGDALALVEGEVVAIGTDLAEICRQLVDRLLGAGGELITLVLGAEAPDELPELLRAHLARHWPAVDSQWHDGGQPHYALLIGVE